MAEDPALSSAAMSSLSLDDIETSNPSLSPSFMAKEATDSHRSSLAEDEWKNIAQSMLPRTVIGSAILQNKGAIDWGAHGLLAYGANCTVFVIDTRNVQIIQSLDRHKSPIRKVLWAGRPKYKTTGSPCIQLISGDNSGQIIHWDVISGTPLATLQDGTKPILDMQWVPGSENGLTLAAIHSPYFLVLWDIKKQVKLWKKSFTDTLLSINFDPFDPTKAAFLCPDCILFLDDFYVNKIPASNGRKFYVSTPRMDSSSDESLKGRDRLKKLMKGLVLGETKPKPDEAMTISECLQLTYHKSVRHQLILLYPRDIILVDLHINQTIGVIPIERTMPPLVQVFTTRQRDVLYCLHESGSISMKVKKRANQPTAPSPLEPNSEVSLADFGSYSSEMFLFYENKCQSEMIRQMKGSKVLGISVDPISEKHIGLFLSSGRIVFLEVEAFTKTDIIEAYSLGEIIPLLTNEVITYKLLPMAFLPSISGNITVMKMCSIKLRTTLKTSLPQLLAVGTSSGFVYIFNLSDGTIFKELSVHAHPIRGLEWAGLNGIITYSHADGSKVKNEISMTDVLTGQTISLRKDKPLENPVSLLKVSPLRQFFAIVLKDGPFEIWNLRNLTLIRTMGKKFPHVLALEWSPIHSVRSMQRKLSEGELSKTEFSGQQPLVREHLVFSDNESQLYHFSVGEDALKDGIRIPPEFGIGMVTSIVFKANKIIKGDSDGYLSTWDLKSRKATKSYSNRGAIKYLKFAPGKSNLKLLVLFGDGIDIVDLSQNQYKLISQVKWSRESSKVVDVDWASPDNPVVATEDGWIRVLDIMMANSSSPVSKYQFKDVIFCPALLHQRLINLMTLLLCTQLWKQCPNYDQFTESDGIPEQELDDVNAQLKLLELGDDFANMSITEKCLRVSRFVGDTHSADLWTISHYYLNIYAAEQKSRPTSEKSDAPKEVIKKVNYHRDIEPLDSCYDCLIDPFNYQRLQLDRVSLHEWKRGDYVHTQRVVEKLVLLGEMDRAVQLLLETDIDNPNYYVDAVKACLVATIQQTGAAQSTIKLVATNLIANGKIWEGVQLLCLIGKGLDGCRYLTSYGMWESAVWLAKSILPASETLEVMKKYADHLIGKGDVLEAILVLISQFQFSRAIDLLLKQCLLIPALLLLMSCEHYGVPIDDIISCTYDATVSYLKSVGNTEAATYFSKKLKA